MRRKYAIIGYLLLLVVLFLVLYQSNKSSVETEITSFEAELTEIDFDRNSFPISSEVAVSNIILCLDKNTVQERIGFMPEGINIVKGNYYYTFRGYFSETEIIKTFGRYYVNVQTGLVYEYKYLDENNKLILLQNT